MLRILRLLALFSLCLSLLPSGAAANEAGLVGAAADVCPWLDATDPRARDRLMHYVCFHRAAPEDPAHTALTPDQLPSAMTWQQAGGNDLVFSHTPYVYWLRLRVNNPSEQRQLWYLKLNYPLLDEVTFWQSSGSQHRLIETGDQRPFGDRGIDYRYFLLPVTLDGGESRDISIRIRSDGALNVPLTFETPAEVIEKSNHLTLTHGLFYGALLVFSVFNLLLFLSSGTIYYLYNAFYMASMGLFLFAMGGFANQYFWPDSTGFANTVIPLALALCALSITLFGRSFLELEKNSRTDKITKALILSSTAFLVLTLVLPYSLTIQMNTLLALCVLSCLFLIAVTRWRQGYQPAMWYVLAWSIMLTGVLIYALAAFGYLEDFIAREALMQIVAGGQVVLLNYAMVQRWRLLNEKLLAVEHSARTNLEFKVHERTAQLRNTMRDLEKANRQLAALSLNDALTGLQNRRYMDNIVPELCAESRRTGQPLVLALLDADHFKNINDTWGHGFGDTFLQLIADVLTRHTKRPRDVAIRFGGEEFALLLPGTTIEGARNVCEAILQDIAETPLTTPDGATATITLSAGLASLAPNEDRAGLFKRADQALYQAKAEGRNRVVVSAYTPADEA